MLTCIKLVELQKALFPAAIKFLIASVFDLGKIYNLNIFNPKCEGERRAMLSHCEMDVCGWCPTLCHCISHCLV